MKLTYTVAEASALLGVSARLVYNEIERGNIRAIEIGRRKLIPAVELERLLGTPLVAQAS